MTDARVARQVAEVPSKPTPGYAVPSFQGEVLSYAAASAGASTLQVETSSSPQPSNLASAWLAESLAQPWPPVDAPTFVVEVLRRDTAASGMVATAMDAFGDRAWPLSPCGVFAFSHDWSEPLVQRLEWKTSVVRLSSGNESRQAQRLVPRATLSYHVGHARQWDALLSDWLVDHLGKPALWPLPQHAVHLTQAAPRGAMTLSLTLNVTGGVTPAQLEKFSPLSPDLQLTQDGLQGWQSEDRWVLLQATDGWQIVPLEVPFDDAVAGQLLLREPLARPAAAGSCVVPVVWGVAHEAAPLTQWVPGMVGASVTTTLGSPVPPNALAVDDPWLDAIPVWPDGNWRDDPTVSVDGEIARQDFSSADAWVRRNDPWSVSTLQRRYLASNLAEIEVWRARLWRTQGRLRAFWLPDGLAPVLWVTSEASPDAGYLRLTLGLNLRLSGDVGAGNMAGLKNGHEDGEWSGFWHRPAACVIVHPNGHRQYVLTSTSHFDQGGVLVLRSGLVEPVPRGSRVLRLVRCRLDHDAIDLYWHSPQLMEITLRARQLPEPRGYDRQTYYMG